MSTIRTIAIGLVSFAAFSAAAAAGSLADDFAVCAAKYNVPKKLDATVVLSCNAADGKLEDCKVIETPEPKAVMSMAATCIATRLPIGSKTGETRVPIKFTPQS